jgi:hypothetical protein
MLDIYFNTEDLKKIFRYFAMTLNNFLPEFAEYIRCRNPQMQKPDIATRLKYLSKFTSQKTSTGAELIKYVWLRSGLTPKEYAIKSARISRIDETMETVYLNNRFSEMPPKRAFNVKFPFNPEKLLDHPENPDKNESVELLFLTAYGNRIIKILRHGRNPAGRSRK